MTDTLLIGNVEFTDRVGAAEGRAQRVCVLQRRCTLPGHVGGNGWGLRTRENRGKKTGYF